MSKQGHTSNSTTKAYRSKQLFMGTVAILALIIFLWGQGPNSIESRQPSLKSAAQIEEKESKDALSQADLAKFQAVYQAIQSSYIEDIDKKELIQGALKGMVGATQDPFSEYLTPEETQPLDDSMDGSFTGIGVQFTIKEGKVTVIAPIDKTPAQEAGILANDIFIAVDGKKLEGLDTQAVVQLIRGKAGSSLTLTVQRGDSQFDVDLVRAEIPLTTVEGKLDPTDKEVGYLKISQFASTTYEELVDQLDQLRTQGAKRFIFDLRYNPGGLLPTALSVTNLFMENGQVLMQVQEKDKQAMPYFANDNEYGKEKVTEPYVVLVDEGSASASEILAVAISENTDRPLVGTTTFGKGTVQTVSELSDYGELKLTIAKWLSPEGHWIHKKGVKPDKQVERPAVAKAITLDSKTPLKKGDASAQVQSASLMLDALGYDLAETSYYDEKMEAAVKAFQKDQGLEVTGQVQGQTSERLMDLTRDYLKEHDPQYQAALDLVKQEK